MSSSIGTPVHGTGAVNVLNYGADSTGAVDSAPAFNAAAATGLAVYAPKGIYRINNQVTLTNSQTLYGDGRGLTFLLIDQNFNSSASSVILCGTPSADWGVEIRDLAFTFAQPDTVTVRSTFKTLAAGGTSGSGGTGVEYPWAIYGPVGAGRIKVKDVQVRGAWNGFLFDTVFWIDNIEMGAAGTGLGQAFNSSVNDWCFVGTYEHWPYGWNTTGQLGIFIDGQTIAMQFGSAGNPSFQSGIQGDMIANLSGRIIVYGEGWSTIANLNNDSDTSSIEVHGSSWFEITNFYYTAGASAIRPAISMIGDEGLPTRLFIHNMYAHSSSNYPIASVAGLGELTIEGFYVIYYTTGTSAFTVSSGVLKIFNANLILVGTHTAPGILQSGGVLVVGDGTQIAGTGVGVQFAADNAGNYLGKVILSGTTITPPSTVTNGYYTGFSDIDTAGNFVGPGIIVQQVNVSSAAGNSRWTAYETNGTGRFLVGVDNIAETGGNTGTNFHVVRENDAGTPVGNPIIIERSSGNITMLDGTTTIGTLLLTGPPTTALQAATKAYVDAGGGGGGGPFLITTNPTTSEPGFVAFPNADIYQSPDSYALTGSMTFRGQPYGYYDTGTLLSIVSTTLPLSSSRAGVNGGFEAGVPAIAAYGSFDLVTLYASVVASPPPLVLHSVTYDATHIYPATPLTSGQIELLRINMWVVTNSIDSTVNPTPAVPNGLPPEIHYGSYVTGWASDGTSITVVGWTVPGSGHTASGQVPPTGHLDPGALNATAYFGSPTNAFGGNVVMQSNPGTEPDDRVRSLQGIEFDFQNYGTTDFTLGVYGLSLDYSPIGGGKATADSYGLKMSGFPTGAIIDFTSFALNTQALNIYSAASPVPWAGSPVTNLTWEAQNYIDSNVLRLQAWTSRDTAAGGWPSASMHLGMRVDGTPYTMTGGSLMAQLVWNAQGNDGGLQIANAAGTNVLTLDNSGNSTFAGEILGPSTAAYILTNYAQFTTRGGFVGSIQTAGTSPGVMGFWNSNLVLNFGRGAGDIGGTPISTVASLDAGGNMALAGSLTLGGPPTAPLQAATKAYVDASAGGNSPLLSVTSFSGIDPTGVADSTAGINAMFSSVSSGVSLYWPAGTYKISSVITVPSKTMTWQGAGRLGTTIYINNSNCAAFIFNSAVNIADIGFTGTATLPTSGTMLTFNSGCTRARFERFWMVNFYSGININGPSDFNLLHGQMFTWHTLGTAVVYTGGVATVIDDLIVQQTTAPGNGNGIVIYNGGVTMSNCSFLSCGNAMYLGPGSGQAVNSNWVINSGFDSCVNGLVVAPTGSGGVQRCWFIGCWFGGCSQYGIQITSPGGSGQVNGLDFLNCHILGNTSYGIVVSDANTLNLNIENCKIAGNGQYGIDLAAGLHQFNIRENTVGPYGGFGGNAAGGINVGAASTFYKITGNNLISQTNPLVGVGVQSTGGTPGSSEVVTQNIAYRDQNRGQATINSGLVSVLVAHGLGGTPNLQDIILTNLTGMGNPPQAVPFVLSPNSSNFTIEIGIPLGFATGFTWQAKLPCTP